MHQNMMKQKQFKVVRPASLSNPKNHSVPEEVSKKHAVILSFVREL